MENNSVHTQPAQFAPSIDECPVHYRSVDENVAHYISASGN